ncbi:hypothetical protein HK104_003964 [Borealophlyctis nickersoniae]|nr:hypothetical protein HK104_003964 [Borealophlyctis nickersoniae]
MAEAHPSWKVPDDYAATNGDSGGPVYDPSGFWLGMIIGELNGRGIFTPVEVIRAYFKEKHGIELRLRQFETGTRAKRDVALPQDSHTRPFTMFPATGFRRSKEPPHTNISESIQYDVSRSAGGMATGAPSTTTTTTTTPSASSSATTAVASTVQSREEVISFIRSCVALTSAMPRGAKVDGLLGMEKLDENFHRYAFVRHLQRRMEAVISPSLDAQLRAAQETAGHNLNPLVPTVVDKIMASPEYSAFVSSIVDEARTNIAAVASSVQRQRSTIMSSSVSASVSSTLSSFRETSSSANGGVGGLSGQQRVHELSFSTQSGATNEISVFCKIDYLSLTIRHHLSLSHAPALEEVRAIGLSINPRNPFDVRLASIEVQRLASFSSSDLLCGEFWPDSRVVLETALADPDSRIVLASLRIYARAFKAAPPHLTGGVYLSLASHLISVFEGTNGGKVADGLNVADPKVEVMLRKVLGS